MHSLPADGGARTARPPSRPRHEHGPMAAAASEVEARGPYGIARGAPAAAADLLEAAAALSCTRRPGRAVDDGRSTQPALPGKRDFSRTRRKLLEECLEELPPGPVRADALVVLAGRRDTASKPAVRALDQALVYAEGDDARLSAVHRERHSFAFNFTGTRRAYLENAKLALGAATRAGDPALLIPALANVCCAGLLGRAWRTVDERAPRSGTRSGAREYGFATVRDSPSLMLGMRHLSRDRLDEARELLEARGPTTQPLAATTGPTRPSSCTSRSSSAAPGTSRAAAAHASRVPVARQQQGEETWEGGPRSTPRRSSTPIWAGSSSRVATAAAREPTLDEVGDEVFRIQNLAVLGFVELSVGDVVRADGLLRPLPPWLIEHGWDEPSVCPAWPNAIEALVGVGELDLARRSTGAVPGTGAETRLPLGARDLGSLPRGASSRPGRPRGRADRLRTRPPRASPYAGPVRAGARWCSTGRATASQAQARSARTPASRAPDLQ